jgi:hypothetical protein
MRLFQIVVLGTIGILGLHFKTITKKIIIMTHETLQAAMEIDLKIGTIKSLKNAVAKEIENKDEMAMPPLIRQYYGWASEFSISGIELPVFGILNADQYMKSLDDKIAELEAELAAL